jgi:hypothetical protein
MLERLQCPDKETIPVAECLSHCRMAERCLTLPTLALICEEREWHGVASTTQLLNGTMMEYLKLTKPYTVDPDSRAFMLQGTKHHAALDEKAKELGLPAEVPLSVDRDIFDLIEFEEGGKIILTDYKLWGSFKVAKALGLVKVGMKPDPSGAVYKTTSKWGKAGEPKMVPIFSAFPENADLWEVELQLNRYRVKLADLGLKVHRMQVQTTVRDGGISVALSRGVYRNMYRIPIKELEDDYVLDYFAEKDQALAFALSKGAWELPCSDRECWDGVRCSGYCDVAMYCPRGQIVKQLDKEREEKEV